MKKFLPTNFEDILPFIGVLSWMPNQDGRVIGADVDSIKKLARFSTILCQYIGSVD